MAFEFEKNYTLSETPCGLVHKQAFEFFKDERTSTVLAGDSCCQVELQMSITKKIVRIWKESWN